MKHFILGFYIVVGVIAAYILCIVVAAIIPYVLYALGIVFGLVVVGWIGKQFYNLIVNVVRPDKSVDKPDKDDLEKQRKKETITLQK